LVLDTLIKKYVLLLKGAMKYDKLSLAQEYEKKIKIYKIQREKFE